MWNIISQGPWSEVPSWHAHSEKTLSEYVRYNSYENSSRLTRDALGTSDYKPYVAKLTSTFWTPTLFVWLFCGILYLLDSRNVHHCHVSKLIFVHITNRLFGQPLILEKQERLYYIFQDEM